MVVPWISSRVYSFHVSWHKRITSRFDSCSLHLFYQELPPDFTHVFKMLLNFHEGLNSKFNFSCPLFSDAIINSPWSKPFYVPNLPKVYPKQTSQKHNVNELGPTLYTASLFFKNWPVWGCVKPFHLTNLPKLYPKQTSQRTLWTHELKKWPWWGWLALPRPNLSVWFISQRHPNKHRKQHQKRNWIQHWLFLKQWHWPWWDRFKSESPWSNHDSILASKGETRSSKPCN